MADQPVIKIVRKKAGHGEHHGGSWKVAYADFVTAMMAFFLVMWILGLDQPSKRWSRPTSTITQFMQEYRKDPAGFVKTYRGGTNPMGKGTQAEEKKPDLTEMITAASRKRLEETQRSIERAINANPDFRDLKKFVQISVTGEGLKIELTEGQDSVFFQSGSAAVEPRAARLLALVAHKLGALPNPVAIEGHTDVVPCRGGRTIPTTRLSSDRANAARRVMEVSGLAEGPGDRGARLRRQKAA